jgi:hypothetical protein
MIWPRKKWSKNGAQVMYEAKSCQEKFEFFATYGGRDGKGHQTEEKGRERER